MKSEKRVLKRRATQVDICPGKTGLILSVGPLSLWLELEDALDVVELLAQALADRAAAPPPLTPPQAAAPGAPRRPSRPRPLPGSPTPRVRRPPRDRRGP